MSAPELNTLKQPPQWGIHKQAVTAVETTAPTADQLASAIICVGWEKVWIDIHFKAATGTPTGVFRPLFWCDGHAPDGEDYVGGFYIQDIIPDIAIVGADNGHKAALLEVNQRTIYLQPLVLGASAEAHVLVQGAVPAHG